MYVLMCMCVRMQVPMGGPRTVPGTRVTNRGAGNWTLPLCKNSKRSSLLSHFTFIFWDRVSHCIAQAGLELLSFCLEFTSTKIREVSPPGLIWFIVPSLCPWVREHRCHVQRAADSLQTSPSPGWDPRVELRRRFWEGSFTLPVLRLPLKLSTCSPCTNWQHRVLFQFSLSL